MMVRLFNVFGKVENLKNFFWKNFNGNKMKWFYFERVYDCRVNCVFNGNFELFVKIYFNFFMLILIFF